MWDTERGGSLGDGIGLLRRRGSLSVASTCSASRRPRSTLRSLFCIPISTLGPPSPSSTPNPRIFYSARVLISPPFPPSLLQHPVFPERVPSGFLRTYFLPLISLHARFTRVRHHLVCRSRVQVYTSRMLCSFATVLGTIVHNSVYIYIHPSFFRFNFHSIAPESAPRTRATISPVPASVSSCCSSVSFSAGAFCTREMFQSSRSRSGYE